jgi:hypothetical protein
MAAKLPAKLEGLGRVDTLSKGAKEALTNMRKEYGASEGNRIFMTKAEEQGTGNTLRQKVNSVYAKGSKLDTK